MTKNLVIVESPAKAKTINKYLGQDYSVLASFGHVRDLPSKDGSVRPDEDFAITYQIDPSAKKHVAAIAKSAKSADAIWLATDPDREGEAISWHVLEVLREKKALAKNTKIHRIAFNAITKSAIAAAIKQPRDIDMNLVNAQQARRALDYLVGFTLSPLLWRKLPGSRSAGRVQSVALRLICEREAEIEDFTSTEYWDISAKLSAADNKIVEATLTSFNGKKLAKHDITNKKQAEEIANIIQNNSFYVANIENKETKRHPAPPFITSTLQQEASRKLSLSAKQTMSIAQKLYESGLITYMRTDGLYVSPEAIDSARSWIANRYGAKYIPDQVKIYKSKAKNAQEAHEAIRPTDVNTIPEKTGLSGVELELYSLIWKRMVASQMASAVFNKQIIEFNSTDEPDKHILRATGSVMKFAGFMELYRESSDDENANAAQNQNIDGEQDKLLPALQVKESLKVSEILPAQHFTQPPPRYSEASLVKKMEELGIGRPSTYASIIAVLLDREYVTLQKKRFVAEARGRIVNAFLESFFTQYVEYDFTAQIEEKLDLISAGKLDWKQLLREWWSEFNSLVNTAKDIPNSEILKAIDKLLVSYLYGANTDTQAARKCPKCQTGELSLKTGKFGAFIGCSKYPECSYTKPIGEEETSETSSEIIADEPKLLGTDPESKQAVFLKKGPYGLYVQLGDDEQGAKPKRVSLPPNYNAENMNLQRALELLALPRDIGKHPVTKKMITAGIGRYGPYLKHDGKFTAIPAEDDVYTIGTNRAVDILASAEQKQKSSNQLLRCIGKHPEDGADINLYNGRYGPYVKYGKTNASLPKHITPDEVTIEQALQLLREKSKAPKQNRKKTTRKRTKNKAQ